MKIITNNVPRLLINAYELNRGERNHFDYLDWEAIDRGDESATFFRYRESLYDLSEFERIDENRPNLKALGWHGIKPTSYFDAVVIRIDENDADHIVVGHLIT